MDYISEFTGPQIDERLGLAGTAYQKPETGIPAEDLSEGVNVSLEKAEGAYQLPEGGIPKEDLSEGVQDSLDKADGAYIMPEGGIPKSDLSSEVISSIDKADTAVQPSALSVYKTKTQPFTNPVGPWRPDPCFWKGDDGYFYVKGTGSANTVLRTRDFVHYENTGRTFLSESAVHWLNTNYGHYASDDDEFQLVPHHWAPQVLKIGNNWVLYMAIVERVGTKDAPTESTAHIVAFTSRTPYGNFTNPVTIVSDDEVYVAITSNTKWNNVIDPFVYCDPDDNKLYLIGGSSYAIRRVRLTDNGLELAAGTYAQHVAGQSINTNPNRETVYEGAYLYSRPHNGTTYWYLFVSAGHYDQRDYCLRVGRSTKANGIPSGSSVNYYGKEGTSMRNGGGTLILSTESDDSQFWGPGHLGGIFESADGRTFVLYHCHDGNGNKDRKLFIQELFWDEQGWPYFANDGHPIASGEVPLDIITQTTIIAAEASQGGGGIEPYFVQGAEASSEYFGGRPCIFVSQEEFARAKTAFLAGRPVIIPEIDRLTYLAVGYSEDAIYTGSEPPIAEGLALYNLSVGEFSLEGAAYALVVRPEE